MIISRQLAKITSSLFEKKNYIKGIKIWTIIPDYIQKEFEKFQIDRKSIAATRFYSSKFLPGKKKLDKDMCRALICLRQIKARHMLIFYIIIYNRFF
jgi:hypothetical protein